MAFFEEILEQAKHVAILGHVRPDGACEMCIRDSLPFPG